MAEGAALEMPYTGNCIVGSNPTLSATQSGHLRTGLQCPENVAMFGDILIEDRASGTQLIQEFVRQGISVRGIQSTVDKIMRLNAQTAAIENGFVYLPNEAHWLEEYLHELTTFPKAKHDDQVDSTAQALAWIQQHRKPTYNFDATGLIRTPWTQHCR